MDNIKSALRFPHPPPPPPPPPPPKHHLVSRFSAETLVVKSPPGPKNLQRFFSSSSNSAHSPPRSPSPPSASVPTPTRPKHCPSASASYLDLSSPKLYDPEVCPWSRTSLDEAEILRTPTLANGRETAWGLSSAHAGGAIGVGKDKFAGAAKEMLELLARKRHGRKRSQDSAKSDARNPIPTSVSGSENSNSSTSPPRSGQHMHVVCASRPSLEGGTGAPHVVGHKLVDLPPRSDSRNAIAKGVAQSTPERIPRVLFTSESSMAPTHPPKPTLRPISPPSISIPPLNPQIRVQAVPLPSTQIDETPPFDAVVLSRPAQAPVSSKQVLIQIDVGGGSSHTTTLETLLNADRAGELGRFVASTLATGSNRGEAVQRRSEKAARPEHLELPRHVNNDENGSDSGSSVDLTLSHFKVSPQPSPFPFMHYSSHDHDDCENDCSSPIDPLAPQLFLPMPSFAPPPPPLRLELDPLPSTRQVNLVASPGVGSKHLSVHPTISSNASPGLSGFPSEYSSTSPRRRMSTTAPCCVSPRSLSYHDVPASPNEIAARRALADRLHLSTGSLGLDDATMETGKESLGTGLEPFFRVVRDQSYETLPPSPLFAASSFDDDDDPDDQTDEKIGGARVSKKEDEVPPIGAGYPTREEDPSRSTMLGIPRGGGSVKRAHEVVAPSRKAVPTVTVQDGTSAHSASLSSSSSTATSVRERPPSLTQSDSTAVAESDYPHSSSSLSSSSLSSSDSLKDDERDDSSVVVVPRLHIFLDRTDVALPSGLGLGTTTLYSTVFSFIRDGLLPPWLSLSNLIDPASSSSSSSSLRLNPEPTTTLTMMIGGCSGDGESGGRRPQVALALGHLAALRTVEREAKWLGIERLEEACRVERERWVEALGRAGEGGQVEFERRRRIGLGVGVEVGVKGQDSRSAGAGAGAGGFGFGEARRKRMKERELEGWI